MRSLASLSCLFTLALAAACSADAGSAPSAAADHDAAVAKPPSGASSDDDDGTPNVEDAAARTDAKAKDANDASTPPTKHTPAWHVVPTPNLGAFLDVRGVWGSAADDVWFVGGAGYIAHWDGSKLDKSTQFTTYELYDVHGSGPNDVWTAGDETQKIGHFDGSWHHDSVSAADHAVVSLWSASSQDAWAGLFNGDYLHWDGQHWSHVQGPSPQARTGISGLDDAHVWSVGTTGDVSVWTGSTWTIDSTASALTGYLGDVKAFSATDVWAVGENGAVIHYDGVSWSKQTSAVTDTLFTVFGSGPSDVWAAGANGALMHYNGTIWTRVASGVTVELNDGISFDSSDAWLVGASGTYLHFH